MLENAKPSNAGLVHVCGKTENAFVQKIVDTMKQVNSDGEETTTVGLPYRKENDERRVSKSKRCAEPPSECSIPNACFLSGEYQGFQWDVKKEKKKKKGQKREHHSILLVKMGGGKRQ
jgi:hypothetical protein